jgi:predicted AlkP superfamily phosphohydrolase/phosphomutase
MTSVSPSRLLVIVLHEASPDLIVPLAHRGALPTFRRILREGACGSLRAPFPLYSPERWGNMVTGRRARQHGLWHFLQRRPDGRFAPIPFGAEFGLKADPVWRILGARGIRCGLVNAPLAYPADVPEGFVNQHLLNAYAFRLSLDPSWRRRMSAPAESYDRIVAELGPYGPSPYEASRETLPSLLVEEIQRQTKCLQRLLAERDWRFCLTRYSQVADAQHFLWADETPGDEGDPCPAGIRRVHEAADEAVGTLLREVGPTTTVFVLSDCGATRLRAGVQLRTWLAQNGFLRRRATPASAIERPATSARVRRALGSAARGLLPSGVYAAVARAAGARPTGCFPGDQEIDWPSTRAFNLGVEGVIFVNVKGRDPFGIVEPGPQLDAIRDDLAGRLARLVDPRTGETAVYRVHTGRELYGESMAQEVPDLLIEWRDHAYLPTEIESEPDSVFVDHRLRGKALATTGGHDPAGILFAVGPGVRPGLTVQGASVLDLVPTWLQFFGVSAPPGLEGRPIAL